MSMLKKTTLAACLMLCAAPALGQSKAAIQKLDDTWAAAFNKGDAAAVAAMYDEDAYVLPPGADMLKGRAAIQAFWGQAMQQMEEIKCTAIDVLPGRRAAREIGTCSAKTKAQPPADVVIKYAVVWRNTGGQWKLLQDIWNTNK
jgi:uncharacterized protein (TIGR02246 family)